MPERVLNVPVVFVGIRNSGEMKKLPDAPAPASSPLKRKTPAGEQRTSL